MQNGRNEPTHVSTAIISYAHDDEPHRSRVLGLAQDLRNAGIDCTLDRFVDPPNWGLWMETEVRNRDWVLVVASPAYLRRSRGEEEPGRGLGAAWEYGFVRQMLYDAQLGDPKFVPIVFGQENVQNIPDALRPRTHYDVTRDDDLKRLIDKLTGRPITVAPAPLGVLHPLGELPVISAGTDFQAAITINQRRAIPGDAKIRPRLYLSAQTPEPGWMAVNRGPVTKLGSYRLIVEVQNKGKGAANKVRAAMEGVSTPQKLGTLGPHDKAVQFVWDLEKETAFHTPPDPPVITVECVDDDGVVYRQVGHLQVRPVSGGYGYGGGNLEAPEPVLEPSIPY